MPSKEQLLNTFISRRAFIGSLVLPFGNQKAGLDYKELQEKKDIIADTTQYYMRVYPFALMADHELFQIKHASLSYYVKDRKSFEVHKIRREGIFLQEDHNSMKPRIYAFDPPGLWIKRTMSVGEEFGVNTAIKWLDTSCNTTKTKPYFYTMKLLEHNSNFVPGIGGELGALNTIVMQHTPFDDEGNPTNPERYYYSKGWGWVGWEEYDSDGNLITSRFFNRIIRTKTVAQLHRQCTSQSPFEDI